MGIIRKIALFTAFVAIGGVAALAAFPAERAYARTYDISKDNIIISCNSDGQKVTGKDADGTRYNDGPDTDPVISGSPTTSNKIIITTASGCSANVVLNGVDIDLSSGNEAAVSITGAGNAVIEISGNNILKSGSAHAGIEKNDSNCSGSLEIRGTGSLTVNGGNGGAGIGGGKDSNGSNIRITGGKVSANGGHSGAGIGGGSDAGAGKGTGSNIIITGGTVTAVGGNEGAGIGGEKMEKVPT